MRNYSCATVEYKTGHKEQVAVNGPLEPVLYLPTLPDAPAPFRPSFRPPIPAEGESSPHWVEFRRVKQTSIYREF